MVYSPQLLSDVWVNSGNSLNITIGQHLDIHTIAVLTCDLRVTGDFSCLLWMFALGGGWSLKIETADNSPKRTHKKWKGTFRHSAMTSHFRVQKLSFCLFNRTAVHTVSVLNAFPTFQTVEQGPSILCFLKSVNTLLFGSSRLVNVPKRCCFVGRLMTSRPRFAFTIAATPCRSGNSTAVVIWKGLKLEKNGNLAEQCWRVWIYHFGTQWYEPVWCLNFSESPGQMMFILMYWGCVFRVYNCAWLLSPKQAERMACHMAAKQCCQQTIKLGHIFSKALFVSGLCHHSPQLSIPENGMIYWIV